MSFILQPAAAGVGTNTAVASGTIANGATVIMNSDGTVTAVGLTTNNNAISFGAAASFSSSSGSYLAGVYDPVKQKVVVAFSSSGNGCYVVVGTVSGTTISFGTPVLATSNYLFSVRGCYHTTSGNCVFMGGYPAAGIQYAFAVSTTGTVPTAGTPVSLGGNSTLPSALLYDSLNDKCLAIWIDNNQPSYISTNVFTVSGTTVTAGSQVAGLFAWGLQELTAVYTSDNKPVVVAYTAIVGQYTLLSYIGVVSGSSMTLYNGSTVATQALYAYSSLASCFDSTNNKIFLMYSSNASIPVANNPYAAIGTQSNFACTWGTPVQISTTLNATYNACAFNSSIGKVDLTFLTTTGGNSNKAAVATVSGTTATFGSLVTSQSSYVYSNSIVYDSVSQKFVLLNSDGGGSNGAAYVGSAGQATNLTSTNFFGISLAAYASGVTASINTIGAVSTNQTGLTPGTAYYIQDNGSLGTSPGTVSVYAGLAKSTTAILIKG
jgi:hypothetical protein